MSTATRLNYFNVLEALLAQMPPGEYKADVGARTQAILKLRDQYGGTHPELFNQLHFVQRPPAPPYSREVSDFFTTQAFGGIKQVMNLAYENMHVTEEIQQELQSRNVELVGRYAEPLTEMAVRLTAELRVSADSST